MIGVTGWRAWVVGAIVPGALLLGGCGDDNAADPAAADSSDSPSASVETSRAGRAVSQRLADRAERDRRAAAGLAGVRRRLGQGQEAARRLPGLPPGRHRGQGAAGVLRVRQEADHLQRPLLGRAGRQGQRRQRAPQGQQGLPRRPGLLPGLTGDSTVAERGPANYRFVVRANPLFPPVTLVTFLACNAVPPVHAWLTFPVWTSLSVASAMSMLAALLVVVAGGSSTAAAGPAGSPGDPLRPGAAGGRRGSPGEARRRRDVLACPDAGGCGLPVPVRHDRPRSRARPGRHRRRQAREAGRPQARGQGHQGGHRGVRERVDGQGRQGPVPGRRRARRRRRAMPQPADRAGRLQPGCDRAAPLPHVVPEHLRRPPDRRHPHRRRRQGPGHPRHDRRLSRGPAPRPRHRHPPARQHRRCAGLGLRYPCHQRLLQGRRGLRPAWQPGRQGRRRAPRLRRRRRWCRRDLRRLEHVGPGRGLAAGLGQDRLGPGRHPVRPAAHRRRRPVRGGLGEVDRDQRPPGVGLAQLDRPPDRNGAGGRQLDRETTRWRTPARPPRLPTARSSSPPRTSSRW